MFVELHSSGGCVDKKSQSQNWLTPWHLHKQNNKKIYFLSFQYCNQLITDNCTVHSLLLTTRCFLFSSCCIPFSATLLPAWKTGFLSCKHLQTLLMFMAVYSIEMEYCLLISTVGAAPHFHLGVSFRPFSFSCFFSLPSPLVTSAQAGEAQYTHCAHNYQHTSYFFLKTNY